METKQEYEVKKVGRPRTYSEPMPNLNFRLPHSLLWQVDNKAKRDNVDRSTVIRQALEEFFSPG